MLKNRQQRRIACSYLVDGEQGIQDVVKFNGSYNRQYRDTLFSEKNILRSMKEVSSLISKTDREMSIEERIAEIKEEKDKQSVYSTYFSKQGNTAKKKFSADNVLLNQWEINSNSDQQTLKLERSISSTRTLSNLHSEHKASDPLKKMFTKVSPKNCCAAKKSCGSLSNDNFTPFKNERDSLGFILNPISDYTKSTSENFRKQLKNLPIEKQHISLIIPPSKENVLVMNKGLHFFDKGIQMRAKKFDNNMILNLFSKGPSVQKQISKQFEEQSNLSNKNDKDPQATTARQILNYSQDRTFTPSQCQVYSTTPSYQEFKEFRSNSAADIKAITAQDTKKSISCLLKYPKDPIFEAELGKEQEQSSSHILSASTFHLTGKIRHKTDEGSMTSPTLLQDKSKSKLSNEEAIEGLNSRYNQISQGNNQENQLIHINQLFSSTPEKTNAKFPENFPLTTRNTKSLQNEQQSTRRQENQILQSEQFPSTSVKMKLKNKEGQDIHLGRFALDEQHSSKIRSLRPNENEEQFWKRAQSSREVHFRWKMNALDQAQLHEPFPLNNMKIRDVQFHNNDDERKLFQILPNPAPCHYDPKIDSIKLHFREVIIDKSKVTDSTNPKFSIPTYSKEPPLNKEAEKIEQEKEILYQAKMNKKKEEGYEVMFNDLMKDIKNEVKISKVQAKELKHPMNGLLLSPVPHQSIIDINKKIAIKTNSCKVSLNNIKFFLRQNLTEQIPKQMSIQMPNYLIIIFQKIKQMNSCRRIIGEVQQQIYIKNRSINMCVLSIQAINEKLTSQIQNIHTCYKVQIIWNQRQICKIFLSYSLSKRVQNFQGYAEGSLLIWKVQNN